MARRAGTLIGLLLVVAAAVVCVMFAPTNLGGHTTYVATHGTSMQPRFHSGDLAIVQPAPTYHVGEIAAYHSSTLRGAVVLHRIIAIDAGHFRFKGDNNDFVDPDQPTADQVVGRLRYRIPHGGEVRAWLAKPFVLFPLLALAIGGAGSGLVRGKRRRRRRGQARAPAAPGVARTPGPRRRLRVVVPIAAALIAAGYVVAGVAVWNLPTTSSATRRAPYKQSLSVAYTATAPNGAAYPDGRVTTGQTLFTHLVHRVDIGFTYQFDSATAHQVHGAYDVVAEITSVTGWQRQLVLRPPRHFSGDRLRRVGHARSRDAPAHRVAVPRRDRPRDDAGVDLGRTPRSHRREDRSHARLQRGLNQARLPVQRDRVDPPHLRRRQHARHRPDDRTRDRERHGDRHLDRAGWPRARLAPRPRPTPRVSCSSSRWRSASPRSRR